MKKLEQILMNKKDMNIESIMSSFIALTDEEVLTLFNNEKIDVSIKNGLLIDEIGVEIVKLFSKEDKNDALYSLISFFLESCVKHYD